MKAALFGKRIDKTSIGRLLLFVNNLKEYKHMEFCYHSSFYELIQELGGVLPDGDVFTDYNDLPADIDIFLSLGGDGTFLDSLTMVRDREIPIAGINFGRLGFLTTACVQDNNPWIEKLIKGDYSVEERALLHLQKDNLPEDFYPYAMNEISIQRMTPSMLEIDIAIDGHPLPKYWADGILVATATGSTAYSMSAGGPIVCPDCRLLLLTPVSPHNLSLRPMAIPVDSKIEITVESRSGDYVLCADSEMYKRDDRCTVHIATGDFKINVVQLPGTNFYDTIRKKLYWGEDMRNSKY